MTAIDLKTASVATSGVTDDTILFGALGGQSDAIPLPIDATAVASYVRSNIDALTFGAGAEVEVSYEGDVFAVIGADTVRFQSSAGTDQAIWDFIDNSTNAAHGGLMRFHAKDSLGVGQVGAIINGGLADHTAGAFIGGMDFITFGPSGAIQAIMGLIGGASPGLLPGADDTYFLGSAGQRWRFLNVSDGVNIGALGAISFGSGDVTLTHASNQLTFGGASSGYLFDGALAPTENDAAPLGAAAVSWSDLFLALGGVVNWANSDVTISHSANQLIFAGGAYLFDGTVAPNANDGSALGSTVVQWSDLFLAEGGVINWDNGDVTMTQAGNSLTVAGGNLIFPGTSTNDDAAGGQVGEFISSNIVQGSAVSLTTATIADVTSISLTAGDWDVFGNVWFFTSGTTEIVDLAAWINTVSATSPTHPGDGAMQRQSVAYTVGFHQGMNAGQRRISVASTTTVYLTALASFSISTLTAGGFIGARRVR